MDKSTIGTWSVVAVLMAILAAAVVFAYEGLTVNSEVTLPASIDIALGLGVFPDVKERLARLPCNDSILAGALRGLPVVLGVAGLDPEFSMVRTGARKRLGVGSAWTSSEFDV